MQNVRNPREKNTGYSRNRMIDGHTTLGLMNFAPMPFSAKISRHFDIALYIYIFDVMNHKMNFVIKNNKN